MSSRGLTSCAVVCCMLLLAVPAGGQSAQPAQPLVIGETFVLQSTLLHEPRRINVYAPAGHTGPEADALPVLYMPDGGIGEDFLHVAGLVQVLVGNGTMRPFLLVGIENTQRRRDLTGPTDNAEDRKIAPQVGGSRAFRAFLREELMPQIAQRYRVTGESAIVGESLAGLFVVETFLLQPDLFDTYIAFDPSLWWNSAQLVGGADSLTAGHDLSGKTIFLAHSDQPEIGELTRRLSTILEAAAPKGLRIVYRSLPDESHATIYHPAALAAFRAVLAPAPPKQ